MANLNDFQEQLDILSATKTSIKEAIIGKGQEVSSEDSFSSYADKIDDIVTLEEGTADADAVASDIEIGKTAYVNGQKITGNIEKFKSIAGYASILDSDITGIGDATSALLFTTNAYSKSIIPGGNVHIYVYKSRIASQQELTADKLKVGETVLGITGTFTNDADATAQDIAYNKTAYVNGTKVTGSIETIGPNEEISGMLMDATTVQKTTIYDEHDNPYPGIQYTFLASGNTLTRDGADVSTNAKYSDIVSALSGTADRISADKIKQGETILGITGNVVELNGDTETVTPTTSQQVITPTSPKNGFTQVTVNAVTSAIDNNIQAGNIKKGVTILGVSGKSSVVETDDATATNSDIASGKTAYVNGNKVVGVIVDRRNSGASIVGADVTDTNPHRVTITGTGSSTSEIINSSTSVKCEIANNSLASGIGLTADKIKQGVTIIGITGTFTNDADATASDILSSKTAYVNGQKVTGTISSIGWGFNEAQLGDMSLNNHRIYINPVVSQASGFYTPGVQAKITTSYSNIATLIGLSADKIKQGETILDIAGTAQVIKEYSTYQEIEQALLDGDIETGDIVLCGGTYTFYLCEMNTETGDSYLEKLVKESETISPSDYTEAEEQIGDLFGEEENN